MTQATTITISNGSTADTTMAMMILVLGLPSSDTWISLSVELQVVVSTVLYTISKIFGIEDTSFGDVELHSITLCN